MTGNKLSFKTTAIALATSLIASTAMPVVSASAHDRHNAASHFGHGTHLNKKRHRQFHNRFGRGHHGTKAYRKHVHRHHGHSKKRKSSKGDLIAAGIIGLAVGAIIASESSKRKQPAYHAPQPNPYNSGSYGYQEPYYGNTQGHPQPHGGQHIPLNQYQEPEVITFNDPSNLQPWTPGWREWCQNRYRSFNARTGTFRGFDGLDHFCVPK